jgi:hypothetical protein
MKRNPNGSDRRGWSGRETFAQLGQIQIYSGRHRPANIFPPVFAGPFHFFHDWDKVGFHPISEALKKTDTGMGNARF